MATNKFKKLPTVAAVEIVVVITAIILLITLSMWVTMQVRLQGISCCTAVSDSH